MAESPSHAELAAKIGALQARMEDTRADVADIKRDVAELKEAVQMGRGAWWALVKLGGVLVMLTGAAAWLWQHALGK